MTRQRLKGAATVFAALLAMPMLGCSSDDDGSYRSSRDYDRGSDVSSGVYRPEPMPGYNARQARNAQRQAERDAERYDRYDR